MKSIFPLARLSGRMERASRSRAAKRRLPSFAPSMMALEPRIALSASGPSSPPGGGSGGAPSGLGYSFTNWPIAQMEGFEYTTENTYPIVGPSGQTVRADEDWVFRDPFPVTDLDGNLAQIDGWYVMAGLAAPRGAPTLDEYSYIISKDGVNWQEGGTLISVGQPGILGDQLFSGDLRYDEANQRLIIYYTPVQGRMDSEYVQSPSGRHMRQEIAISEATPVATDTGLTFTNFVHHGLELVPDGKWYVTPEAANTETEVYGFRDPWLFRDPESGFDFMLFVGNWGSDQNVGYADGAVTGDERFPAAGPMEVVTGIPRNDGVAGIALATDDTLTNWELLPPLFGAIGVNTQLELPHFVYEDGRYYLFTSTHNRTFIDELKYDYPEGLYGFVADDLQGPYEPLNGTGLVFANPPESPLQNYAWKVVKTGPNQAEVFSFINKGGSGTISPSVKLRIKGNSATIEGYQPPTGLPPIKDPGLPLLFGFSPTAPRGSVPPTLTGVLDAGSDLGGSSSDGVTSDSTPTYTGNAPAGSTVRLIVVPEGSNDRLVVGQTTAGPDGTWSITASELPDGTHEVLATTGLEGPPLSTELGSITIDTTAPTITGASFDPRRGQMILSLEDNGTGVDSARLADPSAYSPYAQLGWRTIPLAVTQVTTQNNSQVALTLRQGRRLPSGRYGLNVVDGALADLAGNSAGSFSAQWTNFNGRVIGGPSIVANSGSPAISPTVPISITPPTRTPAQIRRDAWLASRPAYASRLASRTRPTAMTAASQSQARSFAERLQAARKALSSRQIVPLSRVLEAPSLARNRWATYLAARRGS